MLENAQPKRPALYIIMHPGWATQANPSGNWIVVKRNQHGRMEHVAEVRSYDSATAVIPTGLVKRGVFFDLEFWEEPYAHVS